MGVSAPKGARGAPLESPPQREPEKLQGRASAPEEPEGLQKESPLQREPEKLWRGASAPDEPEELREQLRSKWSGSEEGADQFQKEPPLQGELD